MEIQAITISFAKTRMREQIEYINTLDRNTERGLEVYNSASNVLKYWINKVKDMESAVGRFTTSKDGGIYNPNPPYEW